MPLLRKPKIGLALGSGGARGLAHLGVLKVLELEKIPIDFIAGTSSGALIGAMYALEPYVEIVEQKVRDFLNSPLYKKMGLDRIVRKNGTDSYFSHAATYLKERIVINLAYSRTSLVSNKKLAIALSYLLPNVNIEQTRIPFCTVATDLNRGRDMMIKAGDLVTAITASSSIPGFLPPVSLADNILLDGCVSQNVPVDAAFKLGADIVIAVNVMQQLAAKPEYDNIFEILVRTGQITSNTLTNLQLLKADIVISPEVGQFHWSEFNCIDQIIELGIQKTEQALPQIIKKIKKKFF